MDNEADDFESIIERIPGQCDYYSDGVGYNDEAIERVWAEMEPQQGG